MVRELQRVIGDEAREQCHALLGGAPDVVVACVGAHRAARLTRRFRRNESAMTGRLHRLLAHASETATEGPDEQVSSKDKPPGRRAESKISRVEGSTTIAIHAVLAVSTCAILVLAIEAGRARTVSPGEVFMILIYVTLMHNKTVSFGRMIVRLGRVVTSAERLAGVAVSKRQREQPEARPAVTTAPVRSP